MKKEYEKYILLGIEKDGDIIYFEKMFWHSPTFHGAVGTIIEYRNKEIVEREWEEAEKSPTDYIDRDYWVDEVTSEHTDESYEDWATSFIEEQKDESPWLFADSGEAYFITSKDEKKIKKALDSKEDLIFALAGGGRCFSPDDEYETIFEPELLKIINEFEQKDMTEERADELFERLKQLYGK